MKMRRLDLIIFSKFYNVTLCFFQKKKKFLVKILQLSIHDCSTNMRSNHPDPPRERAQFHASYKGI